MNSKKHKFFEVFLDNNLKDLEDYLMEKLDEMLDGKLFPINKQAPAHGFDGWQGDGKSGWTKYNGTPTQLLENYNIFSFNNEAINNLRKALQKATVEACDYYDLDIKEQNYYIKGWFNCDWKQSVESDEKLNLHDHSGGFGAPWFHGYYCVRAEPSITKYQIGGKGNELFDNVNLNNRAIVSETGHPHSISKFNWEGPRLTIAYDITPDKYCGGSNPGSLWIPLFD
jgi:hypothetical protein